MQDKNDSLRDISVKEEKLVGFACCSGFRKIFLMSFFICFSPENVVPGHQYWPMGCGGVSVVFVETLVILVLNFFSHIHIYSITALLARIK